MKKKITTILSIISVLILGFGLFAGGQIRNELVANTVSLNGQAISELGSVFMRIVIIVYSLAIVGCIWIIYGIILLISKIIKKNKKH